MIVEANRNPDLIKFEVVSTEKKTVHSVQILDASGSMEGPKYNAAIKALNDEIKELKTQNEVNYTLTVVEFDSGGRMSKTRSLTKWTDVERSDINIMPHYWMTGIDKCSSVKGFGAYGGTPLYYTIYKVLEKLKLEMKDGESAVVTITTDGMENTSPPAYEGGVKTRALIEEYRKYGINTTFMGTKQDIDVVVKDLGISRGNTFAHQNTADSISRGYTQRVNSMKSYSKCFAGGQSANTAQFFNSEEK